MEILKTLIWVVNLLTAITIIVLVLMQHGKGADAGAAFGGGGSSGSLFGASGSANFLSRATAVSAVVFFSTCLTLVYLSSAKHDNLGVMGDHAVQTAPQIPAGAAKDKPSGSKIPE